MQQPYPMQGYPPQQGGGYPPQQGGGYPPQQGGSYPPVQGGGGYPPMPAGPPRLGSKVELFISAKNLTRMDLGSRSDPFVVVSVGLPRPGGNQQWQEVGRSEVIRDTQNPSWSKQFVMDYFFEEVQYLRLQIWDFDDGNRHDFQGQVELPLARVMAAAGSTVTLPLTGAVHLLGQQTVTIRASEIKGNSNDELRLAVHCTGLDKKDLFGSSDPFVVINRVAPDGGRSKVWSSPVIKNNLNPSWPEVSLTLQLLCNGNMDAPLEVQVFDWDSDGTHDLIGTFQTTVNQLIAGGQARASYPLVNPKKVGRIGYRHSGQLTVDKAAVVHIPSLLDYIRGGCQINLVVAVDYTGSNGDPRSPSSLHFISGVAPNEYLAALQSVGSILLEYDSDKQVPMYGFGGSINGQTRHCFALTFNDSNPEVAGMEGMVAAYKNSFMYVGLSGPTLLAPMIQQAHRIAAADGQAERLKYTVLLLLTDGQSNDLAESVAALVDASSAPMSVVVVGVGGADFSAMDFLDGDGKALSANGRVAQRDIVQFVPFRKFAGAGPAAGPLLAAATLAEIPNQLVRHFISRGLLPHPPLQPAPQQQHAVPVPLQPVAAAAV